MRQPVSPIRHDGPFRAFGLHLGPAVFAPPQPPGWAHLVSLRAGAATLRTDRHVAHVSANVAVWVTAGTPYALELHGPCSLRVGYVAPEFAPARAFGPVTMTPLLREILERATASGYLDPSEARDARLLAVARDELGALEGAAEAFVLPLPRDPQLMRAARSMLDDRDAFPSVPRLASLAGMSTRTFQRRFLHETGLTPRVGATAAVARGDHVAGARDFGDGSRLHRRLFFDQRVRKRLSGCIRYHAGSDVAAYVADH